MLLIPRQDNKEASRVKGGVQRNTKGGGGVIRVAQLERMVQSTTGVTEQNRKGSQQIRRDGRIQLGLIPQRRPVPGEMPPLAQRAAPVSPVTSIRHGRFGSVTPARLHRCET
jgi:hypothetical protein